MITLCRSRNELFQHFPTVNRPIVPVEEPTVARCVFSSSRDQQISSIRSCVQTATSSAAGQVDTVTCSSGKQEYI